MKISLFTLGTAGDVDPVIALAKRLQAEYEVQACSVDLHEKRFKELGVDFVCVGESAFQPANMDESFDLLLKSANPIYQFAVIADMILYKAGERYQRCLKALETTDLAICHLIDAVAIAAVLDRGIPWISMRFDALGVDTTQSPLLVSFGNRANRYLWELGRWLLGLKVDGILRQRLPGVVARHPSLKMFRTYSPYLNLIAISPEVCSISPGLPHSFRVTGHWFLDGHEYVPPPSLAPFLESYPRPVVVGFGSVAGSGLAPLVEMSVAAVRAQGFPVIVQSSGLRQTPFQEEADVFWAGYIPHGFLLPRSRFLIHHGGAGTSMAVCRGGIPSIVIPHNSDQFYWALKLYELGVAPRPLKRARATRDRLEALIKEVAQNPQYQSRATELRRRVQTEDGVGTAAGAIAQLVAKLPK